MKLLTIVTLVFATGCNAFRGVNSASTEENAVSGGLDGYFGEELLEELDEEITGQRFVVGFPKDPVNERILKVFQEAVGKNTPWASSELWKTIAEGGPKKILLYLEDRSDKDWIKLIDGDIGSKLNKFATNQQTSLLNEVWIKEIDKKIDATIVEKLNERGEEKKISGSGTTGVILLPVTSEPTDNEWINVVDAEIADDIKLISGDRIGWPIVKTLVDKGNTGLALGREKSDKELLREITMELQTKLKTKFNVDGSVMLPKSEEEFLGEIEMDIRKPETVIREEDYEDDYEEEETSSTEILFAKKVEESDEDWINQINDAVNNLTRDYRIPCRFPIEGINQYVDMKRDSNNECPTDSPNLDLDSLPEGFLTTWMMFADEENNMQVVFLVMDPDYPNQSLFPPVPDGLWKKIPLVNYLPNYNIFFVLCMRSKTDQQIVLDYSHMANVYRVKFLFNNFQREYPTKILIHGWQSSSKSQIEQSIKNAYLAKGKFNVILVDWEVLAANIFYPLPAARTFNVGGNIAHLIDLLITVHGANMNSFHIIGHSLGAHAAGFVNSFELPGAIPRITGLDPASVIFMALIKYFRLDKDDALFVDVIHTCGWILGFPWSIGDADFYPNGGTPIMPGCLLNATELVAVCSHSRAYEYFADSIESPIEFYSYACPSYSAFKSRQCNPNAVLMGAHTPSTARGDFYLQTTSAQPYGMGALTGMRAA